ncbi:hypothetical protein K488DRAFT_40602 [Vararia minispora EC-137]|uniref:Uncharacterized protein n=1 Tax=Vararia minispora EC-137 TaxID=1314806 RepID=A0ACB8QYG3_9AGAM|nr:hypothetical protein K488DRAFT_40602 [Vararia minispora EC-137]
MVSGLWTVTTIVHVFLWLVFLCMLALSFGLVSSQAVRNSRTHSISNNANVIVIGVSYTVVIFISILICINRRISIFRRLQKLQKANATRVVSEAPKAVVDFIRQEYARSTLIAYQSIPKDVVQEGWGRPNSAHAGVQFRRAMLDTISELDELARLVIPHQPQLRPSERMLSHFRFIAPLLPKYEDGLSPLHYYDSAIQLARYSEREPTEREYEIVLNAVKVIREM